MTELKYWLWLTTRQGMTPGKVLMLLDLGFAAEGFAPLPNHTSRKPLEETVKYL